MMKLTYNPASPFVRKATALIAERGLDGLVERVPTDPWSDSDPLPKTNPLGKVPALTLDDGTVLVESALICEYLDSLEGGPQLYPAAGPARWQALELHSLADGILTAGVATVIETLRRPKELQYDAWVARQRAKIDRTLDVLERDAAAGKLAEPLTIGSLTVAIALGYLDFRFNALPWRDGHPALAAWYEGVRSRPSIASTMPKAAS